MIRLLALSAAAAFGALCVGGRVSADERDVVPEVRIRHNTVLRWSPRYRLTASEEAVSADARFWRRADELPLYERLSVDAQNLAGGSVEAHLSTWGALDLTIDTEAGVAAGDVASAWARGRVGAVAGWVGRRFLPWGLVGGMHLDGGGVNLRTSDGVDAEVLVGRPVTPRLRAQLGSRPSFEGPSLAWGARLGHSVPRSHAASVAYVERWAEGIAADRTLSVDAHARVLPELDVSGGAAFEAADGRPEKVDVLADWYVHRQLMFTGGYRFMDPRRVLPSWSILSVFATRAWDEGVVGATHRPHSSVAVRLEGALRSHRAASEQDHGELGYRADLAVRGHAQARRVTYQALASRRSDGELGYWYLHALVVRRWVVFSRPSLDTGLEVGAAFDDALERDALLVRGTADLSLGDGWRAGCGMDLARTAIAAAELRALLRVSWSSEEAER